MEEAKHSVTVNLTREDLEHLNERATAAGKTIEGYLLDLARRELDPNRKASPANAPPSPLPTEVYRSSLGSIFCGDSRDLMASTIEPHSVDLIVTSPPFGLLRQKDYGNERGDGYLEWFEGFAAGFKRVLKPSGSLVIDIGGAWEKGQPTRSLYHFELLVMLCRKFGFHLAQEFFWWNPAKLPTPAEWVNVRRVRVKDAVDCVWWLSPTPYPKASNRRVLQPYSSSMMHLFQHGYQRRLRPSGHDISGKFGRDNGGSIPPNLIALANTESNSSYLRYCREKGLKPHPARFPAGLPAFFVRMLSDKGDLVLDPFAGSCVTGEVCEVLGRRWICGELDALYVDGAMGRFVDGASASLAAELSGKRTTTYSIYSPNSDILSNNDCLPIDGGRSRPKQ